MYDWSLTVALLLDPPPLFVIKKKQPKKQGTQQRLVLVPDPKPTTVWIAFSILEVICAVDEVWGRD